ncbi:MAG: fumarylacetoacetate hydrolase family protein [Cyclobacteriaceae bacterium]
MKIIGIGKNYVSDKTELPQGDVVPVIFVKTENTLLTHNKDLAFPAICKDLKFEIEIALRVGKSVKNVAESEAMNCIDAIALANDLTATDVLASSRENKGPWALAKGFDGATPISEFRPISDFPDIHNINFGMEVNGEQVQFGNTSLMITKPEQLIAYVSTFMTLEPGDIFLTGTPAKGAGYVHQGDVMVGYLEGEKLLETKVV